jgi:hypothetical protein
MTICRSIDKECLKNLKQQLQIFASLAISREMRRIIEAGEGLYSRYAAAAKREDLPETHRTMKGTDCPCVRATVLFPMINLQTFG